MKKLNWPLYLIILLNLFFFTFCFAQKTDLHVDEIYSFGHANSSIGTYLFSDSDANIKPQMLNKWLPSSLIVNYITVQCGEQFDYAHVIKNLSQGVHPPLFHMMLHTVSSFFPDTFSIWFGYVLNLPILILLLILIYKLSFELFSHDNKLACLALVFCSFSLFFLNMAIYIRMYLLWMCLSIALVYYTLRILQQNKASYKMLLGIALISFLCFLTHMYALPFVFFLTASTCLWLAYQKKWRLSLKYGSVILLALLLAYLCFPYLIKIMFQSSRGEQFQAFATYWNFSIFDLIIKFNRLYDLFFSEILNFSFLKSEYFFVLIILALAWGKMQHIRQTKMVPYAWWMFSLVLLFACCLVYFSPAMGTYDDRYFSPILIILALLFIYWMNYFLKTLFLNKRKRLIVLSILILLNVCFLNFKERSVYLFPKSSFSELKPDFDGKSVFVYGCNMFVVNNLFHLLKNTDKVFLFNQYNTQLIDNLANQKNGYLLVDVGYAAWENIEDCNVKKIPLSIKSNLEFLGIRQIGIYFYAIYKIKD